MKTRDFKSNDFVRARNKGLTGRSCVRVSSKGVTGFFGWARDLPEGWEGGPVGQYKQYGKRIARI
jgi:hypothetical protein